MTLEEAAIPLSDPGVPAPHSTSSFWHQPPNSFLYHHRTTPTLPSKCSTVIIGSGIAGSMTFHRLQAAGLAVGGTTVMLEARQSTFGATGRNGGHCKPMLYHYGSFMATAAELGVDETLKHIRFERLNLQLLREYVRSDAVDCEFTDLPSADIFYNHAEFEVAQQNIAALRKAAPELAALIRVVSKDTPAGKAEIERILRTPTAVGAAVFSAAKLWPYKLVSHILTKAVRYQGLNLQTETPALSVSPATEGEGGRWVVATPRGSIRADRIIFATNAHTSHLLPVFRGWIYPVRAQVAALVPPKSLLTRPLTHSYGLVRTTRRMAEYLIQRPVTTSPATGRRTGGEIIVGGARELADNTGVGHQDNTIDEPVAAFLRSAVSRFFPDETGYPGDADEYEYGGLRKSFMERFERLRVGTPSSSSSSSASTSAFFGGGGGGGGHDIWDAAEGMGLHDSDSDPPPPPQQALKECTARAEWSGTMGFSRDERPFVGRVPALAGAPDTRGLWVLAGFEGHGMAYTSGSAKALVDMIQADADGVPFESERCGVFEWFPRSFEVTPERLGLLGDEWVVVDKGELPATGA